MMCGTNSRQAARGSSEPPDASPLLPLLRHSPGFNSHLRLIERMREDGFGEGEGVLKLVVCGSRGVEKSSVFQAVMGFGLGGAGAGFPVEIVWRDCVELEKITARIVVDGAGAGEVDRMSREVDGLDEVWNIIEEVSELTTRSAGALRVEVTGPVGLHLCVVDLPGLVPASGDDESALYNMAKKYLQDPDAVILHVLRDAEDAARHDAIAPARKHDPDGRRTVVVMAQTSPIDQESEMASVEERLDSMKLGLGNFVIGHSPVPGQLSDMKQVRADQLRCVLQNFLGIHAKQKISKACDHIKKSLAQMESELDAMGDHPSTLEDIREFMIRLSMRFRDVSQAAVQGNYMYTSASDPEFFSGGRNLELCAHVHALNTDFASLMREDGLVWPLGGTSVSTSSGPESTNETVRLTVSKTQMLEWVKQECLRLRGKELPGSFSPAIIAGLFRKLSSRWPEISRRHVDDVSEIVSQWMHQAVSRLTNNQKIRHEVGAILQRWLSDAKQQALAELDKLIQDDRKGPLTYNNAFSDAVVRARLDVWDKMVQDVLTAASQSTTLRGDEIDRLASELGAQSSTDMGDDAYIEAYVELLAYYKVARNRFVDNVARQVIERHITSPFPDAFSPATVSRLSQTDLMQIGAETEQQTARRTRLADTVQRLKQDLADLRKPLALAE